jgi:hypothetical protein
VDTPILYIIFNRPDIVAKSFSKIRKIQPSKLYISCDGPRCGKDDAFKINKCFDIIDELLDWKCDVKIRKCDVNLGCKIGVTSAIDWLFENEEVGIVLEDDILVDDTFFEFATNMLKHFKDRDDIFMISADGRATFHMSSNSEFTLSYFPTLWGWATWRDRWVRYDVSYQRWQDQKKSIKLKLSNLAVDFHFFEKSIDSAVEGKIDTWDYQLCGQFFYNDWLCIVPSVNLAQNVGFGEDASHTKNKNDVNSIYVTEKLCSPYKENFEKEVIWKTLNWYNNNEFTGNKIKKLIRRLKYYISSPLR